MKKTFVIVGCGFLGNLVADAYQQGLLDEYEFLGAYSKTVEHTRALCERVGGRVCEKIDELLLLQPDYLVEAASVDLLKAVAIPALEQGCSVIPLSIGAFADESFLERAKAAALRGNSKIHIPCGAVGGFDVLQTVALLANSKNQKVEGKIEAHKSVGSLKNTPLFLDELETSDKVEKVFDGSAKEAIEILPTKVNVFVATALASLGVEGIETKISTVPDFAGDEYFVTIKTEGYSSSFDLYSRTSEIAGWSVVALMRNLASPMIFY